MGLFTEPSSFTLHSSLPVCASRQWPRMVALNFGIAVAIFVEGGEKEAVAPDGDAALSAVGQRRAPEDVLVERNAPLDGRVGGADAPVSVGTGGLRPVGKQKAAGHGS